jgi:hypothetical protein
LYPEPRRSVVLAVVFLYPEPRRSVVLAVVFLYPESRRSLVLAVVFCIQSLGYQWLWIQENNSKNY